MSAVQRPDSRAFEGLLKTSFVANSAPSTSNINQEVEQIKNKAGLLALTMFHPDGKTDLVFPSVLTLKNLFSPMLKFSNVFSQETYGAGFTKGISIILAYVIALDEIPVEARSEAVTIFAYKIQGIASSIFQRMSTGDKNLSDVRKMAEQIDNYGGYYNTTPLSSETAKKLTLEGVLTCPLEIDVKSGHLIAKLAHDLSEQLLEGYRSEIETHLTEDGKNNLKLPYNIGYVVVAYKDELASMPKETLNKVLDSGKHVTLLLKEPYVVPVRGDNRYALVASILVESQDIICFRNGLGLKELYSPGRPLRFTFGAVHHHPIPNIDAFLIDKLKQFPSFEIWKNFINPLRV